MRIGTIQQHYDASFQAKPIAKYFCTNGEKQNAITVYQLVDKADIDFLKSLTLKMEDFYKRFEIKDVTTAQIINEALNAGIKILQSGKEDKAKVLMAYSDNEPGAILIGSILKKDKNGNLHYSSRKNHSKNETELDWLASWNKKIFGAGKALVSEFFYRLIEDGFKQVYVRSEVPEKSYATSFYKKMGFEPLSERQRKLKREGDNNYLIGEYDVAEDLIVPMKATIKDIKHSLTEKKKEMRREELSGYINVKLT